MQSFKARLWRGIGAAALVGGSLVACSPGGEGGEAGAASTQAGEAGEAAVGETGGETGGEAGGGSPASTASGETGEAGASDAYAGLTGTARSVVRLQHFEGFLLASDRLLRDGDPQGAAILTQQGLLEVVDASQADFAGIDLTALRAAATSMDAAKLTPAIRSAATAIDQQQAKLGGVTPDTVKRMLALTRGLYQEAVAGGGVDPTEYQHSFGAALATANALEELSKTLNGPQAQRAKAAQAEVDRLLAMWPSSTAPTTPTPLGEVIAQTSRVELALPRG